MMTSTPQSRRSAKAIAKEIDAILSTRNPAGDVIYGPHILRQSQIEAPSEAAGFFNRGITGGHIIQPGGSGKGHEIVMFADACKRAGGRSLIVVPTTEGVRTVVQRFGELAPQISVGAVYEDQKDYGQPVTVMTYAAFLIAQQSGKIVPRNYSLLVADEGHHFLTKLSDEALDEFSAAAKVAFTATPRYFAGKELAGSRHFGQLYYNLTIGEAVARKECTQTKPRLIDTHVTLEDYERLFARGRLPPDEGVVYERAINQVPWNHTFVNLYQSYTDTETGHRVAGDKALTFCAGIQHSRDMAGQFNAMLMPYVNGRLKYSQAGHDLRDAIKAKGINPERVRFACAPVWGAMDHEGGWEYEDGGRWYSKRDVMKMFEDGAGLTLACDKILAESVDIPGITTILNAVPTWSFVRAGQRGMRAERIFTGDTARKIPPKNYAYVFDGLPHNWRNSLAAPVLFSEFVLRDPHTVHGVEPPVRQGARKPAVREQNPGYQVIWDVRQLEEVNSLMEAKRSIARAEVIPEGFLCDTMAIKVLKDRHKDYPPSSNRLIGHLFQDWSDAYEAAGRPTEGKVTRYGRSIPAENFHFANNRLYLHRDSLPVVWEERQSLLTLRETVAALRQKDHGAFLDDLKCFCNDWLEHDATRPKMKRLKYSQADFLEYQERLESIKATGEIRNYNNDYYIAVGMADVLVKLTSNKMDWVTATEEIRDRRKQWVNVTSTIDHLADDGFVGLGKKELIQHAHAAALAAAEDRPYGGELFLPTDFTFKKVGEAREFSHEPPPAASDASMAHVRGYRIEQFFDALETFHDTDGHEPRQFPAAMGECYAALRRVSRGHTTYREFGGMISRIVDKDRRDSLSDRASRIEAALGFTKQDFALPDGSGLGGYMTKTAYESLRRYLSPPPPDFVNLLEKCKEATFLGSNFVYSLLKHNLEHIALNGPAVTSLGGVVIEQGSVWARDPIYTSHGCDTLMGNHYIYVDPKLLPSLGRLFGAALIVGKEIADAFEGPGKKPDFITLYGRRVPRPPGAHFGGNLDVRTTDPDAIDKVLAACLKAQDEGRTKPAPQAIHELLARRKPRFEVVVGDPFY